MPRLVYCALFILVSTAQTFMLVTYSSEKQGTVRKSGSTASNYGMNRMSQNH